MVANNQLDFTAEQIQQLQTITNDGTTNFAEGYEYVLSIVENSASPEFVTNPDYSDTRFWLQEAAKINSGDVSSASTVFIRSVAESGLAWNGIDHSDTQAASNAIGNTVITQFLDDGGIPAFETILSNDITATLDRANITIAGWGGSFYYWDRQYTDGSGTVGVGNRIMSDANLLAEFIAVNANSLKITLAHELSPVNFDFSDFKEIVKNGFSNVTGIGSPIPEFVREAILHTAFFGGGDVPSSEQFGNYVKDESTGKWYSVSTNGSDGLVHVPAPTNISTTLEAVSLINQQRQASEFEFPELETERRLAVEYAVTPRPGIFSGNAPTEAEVLAIAEKLLRPGEHVSVRFGENNLLSPTAGADSNIVDIGVSAEEISYVITVGNVRDAVDAAQAVGLTWTTETAREVLVREAIDLNGPEGSVYDIPTSGTNYDETNNGIDIDTNFSHGSESTEVEEEEEAANAIRDRGLLIDGGNYEITSVTANDGGSYLDVNYPIADGHQPGRSNIAGGSSADFNSDVFGGYYGEFDTSGSSVNTDAIYQDAILRTAHNNIWQGFFAEIDPLVLDLDDDGVELTAFNEQYLFFDVDNDGAIERTGWVAPDDGILAHDLNGDGEINDITETLSEYYGAAAASGTIYADGFEALATLDSNAVGRIDSADAYVAKRPCACSRIGQCSSAAARPATTELHHIAS